MKTVTRNFAVVLIALAAMLAMRGCEEPVVAQSLAPQPLGAPSTSGPWTLTFSDNFATDTALDATKWSTTWLGGFQTHGGANEVGYYTPDNVSITAGGLAITTRSAADSPSSFAGIPYTTGMISSAGHFSQLYGWFQITLKFPVEGRVGGIWDGFWLRGVRTRPPETDVIESLSRYPFDNYETLWWVGAHGQPVMTQRMIGPSNLEDGKFHTYAVWWSAAFVKWYVDGKCVRALTANVPNVAQFLYFNQAADARSFDPIGTGTPLPATAVIESIDVWQE